MVKDYRLIAYCNTFYEIITKELTNRMKKVMNTIISPIQSAFIEGRSLIDYVVFSHELLKWYSRKGLSLRYVLKVDLRKAYDSAEWCFLKTACRTRPSSKVHWLDYGVCHICAMEYLYRELYMLTLNPRFHFYPRCKPLGRVHICFVDDLLMFCKAESTSIKLMQ